MRIDDIEFEFSEENKNGLRTAKIVIFKKGVPDYACKCEVSENLGEYSYNRAVSGIINDIFRYTQNVQSLNNSLPSK